ncbi:MAG: molybdopterin-binding protein, partial [Methanocorpusculum sp.]|nr:molybdopterin-binding protein [Methanocorpusculum sp.]
RYPPVEDNRVLIQGALENALRENEIVLISAGSSMGSRDYTSGVISTMGKLVFHGVFMKPAKPSMLGIVGGKPVIGMPGFPLSAQTTLRLFVRELLEAWGWKAPEQETAFAVAGDTFPSDAALDEFSFAAVGSVCGRLVALPQMRASSVQMNGIRSNANLHIPRGTACFEPGERVPVVLSVPAAELGKTILIGGLYSSGAEKIAAVCTAAGMPVRFSNLNAVSGIHQLARKACHAACAAEHADLSPLDAYSPRIFPLGDGTVLVMRGDMMTDSLCAALASAAEKLRGQ